MVLAGSLSRNGMASWPTSTSPSSRNDTTEGTRVFPSGPGIIVTFPPWRNAYSVANRSEYSSKRVLDRKTPPPAPHVFSEPGVAQYTTGIGWQTVVYLRMNPFADVARIRACTICCPYFPHKCRTPGENTAGREVCWSTVPRATHLEVVGTG